VFTDDDLKKVEMMNDAMADTKEAFESIFDRLNTIIAPIVTFIAEGLTNAFVKVRQEIKKVKSEIIEGLIKSLVRIGIVVIALGKMFESFANAVINFFSEDGKSATEGFMNSLLTVIGTITFFEKSMANATGNIWDDIKDTFMIIWIAIKSFGLQIINFFDSVFQFMENRSKAMTNSIVKTFRSMNKLLKGEISVKEFFNQFGKDFKDSINQIGKDVLNFEKSLKSLDETFEGEMEKFAKESQKNKSGAIANMLDAAFVGQDVSKFVDKFKMDLGLEGEKLEIKIRKFFETLKLDLEGGGDIVSELTGLQNLVPKLAKKGSQEAAKAEAGIIGVQQQQLAVQKKQLKAQVDANKHLVQILGASAIGGLLTPGIGTIDPFNVSNQVGATN